MRPELIKRFLLYLIEILHQTTTIKQGALHRVRLYLIEILHQTTTWGQIYSASSSLYLIEILHQTTTNLLSKMGKFKLYLIEILHQTTTVKLRGSFLRRCILSKFYIKPQPFQCSAGIDRVVSYRNSTSNHNTAVRFRTN